MIETHSVPTVTFCTHPFRTLALARRHSLGLPDLPIVFLPHPMMTKSREEIEHAADEVIGEVLRSLLGEDTR